MPVNKSVISSILSGVSSGPLGAAGGSASGPDWPNWTGAQDSAIQRFYASTGKHGPTSIVGVASDEFVAVSRQSVTNKFFAAVYTVAGDDTLTQGAEIELTASGQISPNLVKMTDTRYLHLQCGNGNTALTLLGKSGTSLSELVTESTNLGAGLPGHNHGAMTRLSDTHAAYVLRKNGAPDDGFYVGVVSIGGDTMTWGTPVLITTRTFLKYPDITALSATEFVAAAQDKIAYCSVAGTTVVVESNIDIVSGDFFHDMEGMVTVNADTVLLAYEDENGAPDNVALNTFTVSGGVLTRGTPASLLDGSKTFSGPGTGKAVALDAGNFMFVFYPHDEDPQSTAVKVVSVDESNNITTHSRVTILERNATGGAVQGVLTVLPGTGGAKAVLVVQDSTVTPTEQVAFKVLNG